MSTNVKQNQLDPTVYNSNLSRQAIINGNFDVWQRGTSFTSLSNGDYSADRWRINFSNDGQADVSRSTTVPTADESGVLSLYSLKVDITTADTSLAAAQYLAVIQKIEGNNSRVFGFGESGTRYVTLSFWVKSTTTGTYGVAFRNSAANRSYVSTYTIDVADTWEKKIITIPVDPSGAYNNNESSGLELFWSLGCGSNFHTTADEWGATNSFSTSSQENLLASDANDWSIAQVQLCAGDVALPFMPKSYAQELRDCQRYYWQVSVWDLIGMGIGTTQVLFYTDLPEIMRIKPTCATTGTYVFRLGATDQSALIDSWSATGNTTTGQFGLFANDTGGGFTVGGAYRFANISGTISASAEL